MKKQDDSSLSRLQKKCEAVSGLLKVMAHPQRLIILCTLAESEKTVNEIEKHCEASQSSVSQFLKAMRLEGLITSRREGRFIYYRIADSHVQQLMRALQDIFSKK